MMNLRAGRMAILLLAAVSGAQAQTDTSNHNHAFSIQQCIEYAHMHNVQVKNALLDYQIQQQTNRQITSAAYPQLNGSLGTTYYPKIPVQVFPDFISLATYGVLANEKVKDGNGNTITVPNNIGFVEAAFGTKWMASGGVSLSQVLFDGQVFVGLQARQASLDAQNKNAEITEENIKVNIYKVYYQLVVSKSQMEMLDANIARAKKLESDTRALFENGFREKLEVDRASVQLANLETEKLKTQRNIDNGYIGLKLLIGMPVKDSLVLTENISEDKIRDGVLEASNYKYTDRKEYQALNITQSLREYNIKRYKYSYLPSANLSSSYSKNAYRNKFNFFGSGDWFTAWSVGLNISVPIFDGFSRASNVKKAQLELKQTQNLLENMKLSIDNDVLVAQNNFKAAITTLDYQRKNMQLAEQVYNQTKKKFESGLASNTDITNTQTDLINAQTNYVNALYDAILAKVDFSKATGTLP